LSKVRGENSVIVAENMALGKDIDRLAIDSHDLEAVLKKIKKRNKKLAKGAKQLTSNLESIDKAC
jgi:cell division protein FtsB